ncbi:MAG: AsnC family transcriptional regulator [Gammaproteobacteria bacterium]
MDSLDRRIINTMQGDFPLVERPFKEVATELETSENELITRLRCMLDDGVLTRFGPLYNAEKMGGALSLCAMCVPAERFDEVVEQVNALPQVAHNYQRDHAMNMWFVLATETDTELQETLTTIREKTSLDVFDFPKLEEFYVGLNLQV